MRILAMFSAAFAAAAALCAYVLPAAWCWLPGLCLAALAAALLLLHGDPVRRVRTIALGLAAGFLWCWADAGRLVSVRALCGEGQTIEAEVCSLPERTQYGYRCVTLLQGNRMQLYLRNAPEDAALGDRVRVTADVTETGNSLYLASNDILLLGFARGEAEWEHPEQVSLRYAPQRALLTVQRTITNCFPADTAPLAIALVTGDTSGLPYALQTAMSDAGISHIVAVSGMHVTLLLGVVRLLCLRRRRLTAGVGIAVMVFFAAMLGFRPSVTRAVVMNAVLLLAPLLGRENDGPTSLCFALLLLLLPNPRAIANVGLQLSFAAVAGLQLFSGGLTGWLEGLLRVAALRERHPLPARLLRAICASLAATLGALAFTLPLAAWYFRSISLAAPLTNLLALPLFSLAFSLGCVTAVLGLVWLPLGRIAAWPAAWLLRLARGIVTTAAGLPYAAIYLNRTLLCVWLIAATGMFVIFLLQRRRQPGVFAACLAVTLTAAILGAALWETDPVSMTALDVGQGACTVLRGGGATFVVDCGGEGGEAAGETAARELRMGGETSIDGLILTHLDADHCNGAAQLMARVQVRRLFLPEQDSDSREAILTAAERCGTEIVFVTEDLTLDFSGGSLRLFAPVLPGSRNCGLAALMSAGEYDILIPGDMPAAAERVLADTHSLPQVEVLVVGHHGAASSTAPELLQTVSPEIAVISVDADNSYGHPAQAVLDRLTEAGAAVYRTDQAGDITITR